MAYRKQLTKLKAPYLKRVILEQQRVEDWSAYPFDLPLFRHREFTLEFTGEITIIIGENGSGKSTLLEGIAALAGYDEAGGGKGYMPVDHSRAVDRSGQSLGAAMRAHWLPKVTTGWFFRAESFYSVARYLDRVAQEPFGGPPPDFLSWSHGEGFMRFFEERCHRQGIYLLDEPESALSPRRQIELLRLLGRMRESGIAQVIMATHSPLLMACPGARLLEIRKGDVVEAELRDVDHFRMMRKFCEDPDGFIHEALETEP
ncbi:MAG: AAA family ATPase [Rhizobiaceae bacterium]|nr:AAA family ATPase [Rhizobiaceae bacterium]